MTIVYNSNTGHAQRYAEMLGKAEKCRVLSQEEAQSTLPQGEEILFLGWLMAGRVSGLDKAARLWKVKAACGVGMSPPGEQILSLMSKANSLPDAPLFYLQGGWDPKAVGWVKRNMVNMVTRSARIDLEKKTDRTAADERLLIMYKEGADFVEYQNLKPLQDWLASGRK